MFIHHPKRIQNVLQKYSDDEIFNKRFKGGVLTGGLNNFAGKHATVSHMQEIGTIHGNRDYIATGCVKIHTIEQYLIFYLGNSTFECNNFRELRLNCHLRPINCYKNMLDFPFRMKIYK